MLLHGDCMDLLPSIPDGSVDMVLCDLPYGTTRNKWDSVLPLKELFDHYWRVLKPNGAICLFAQQPFMTDLVNVARKEFRYQWVWQKNNYTGFLNCRKMPLKSHELIAVFYRKLPTYNPQMHHGKVHSRRGGGSHQIGAGSYQRPMKSRTCTIRGTLLSIASVRTIPIQRKSLWDFANT